MIRVAAFKVHQGDFLSRAIEAETRGSESHIALEVAPLTIIEAFYPCVRKRPLDPSEVVGIDFYKIVGLTPDHEAKILEYCNTAIADHERYSIVDLFRFNPFFRMFLGEAKDGNPAAFCSMFAKAAIEHSGIKLLNAHDYEVDPHRLTWSTQLEKDT